MQVQFEQLADKVGVSKSTAGALSQAARALRALAEILNAQAELLEPESATGVHGLITTDRASTRC